MEKVLAEKIVAKFKEINNAANQTRSKNDIDKLIKDWIESDTEVRNAGVGIQTFHSIGKIGVICFIESIEQVWFYVSQLDRIIDISRIQATTFVPPICQQDQMELLKVKKIGTEAYLNTLSDFINKKINLETDADMARFIEMMIWAKTGQPEFSGLINNAIKLQYSNIIIS